MYKRYQGNSGRMERVEETRQEPPMRRPPPPPLEHSGVVRRPSRPGLMEQLGRALPGLGESMETEDVLLLLILYLLYRESGDQELLMMMGAMFLL